MEEVITKKEFDELMSIEGEVRGVAFKTASGFIIKEKGVEGLKKIEEIITELGYPIEFRKIKIMNFYPVGLIGVIQLLLHRLFNFDKKKFIEMGTFESKVSLIIRLFMRYFVSLKAVIKEVPKMWKKYYTAGELKVIELNEKEKSAVLRLENFKIHQFHCYDLIGYFPSVLQMIVGGNPICEETKCVFLGDKYHEFLLKW